MAAVVEAVDLHRIYESASGYTHALRGVSLTVEQGEFLAIMGPSGSGDASGGALYGGSMGGAVTYAVKLLIAEPDPRLKPGMTAKATITTTTIDNALMVPISAVQSDGAGGSFVMVVTEPETQDVAQRKVEVVASDGLTSVVKGALKPGDQVVVGGMEGLGGAGGGYAVADGSSGMGMAVSDVSAG